VAKTTPRLFVLKRHPHAFPMQRPFGVVIYEKESFGKELGIGVTARGAWKDAAAKVRRASTAGRSK
jgi:hypothetical protein